MALEDPSDRIAQRNAVFQFFTGKDYEKVSKSPRDMLQFLYEGTSKRHPIDTKTAAARLGVSQRTVQRWIKGDSTPRTEHLKKITDRTRQSVTTKRGRERLAKKVRSNLTGTARSVTVHGLQGLSSDANDLNYNRHGNSHIHLSPDEQEGLINSWVENGDTGALQYLEGIYDQPGRYTAGWQFHGVDGMTWR